MAENISFYHSLLSYAWQSLKYANFKCFAMQENGRVGDDFMNKIQPIAAYVPYMTSPGNHEEA
jgi:hypothetical protein